MCVLHETGKGSKEMPEAQGPCKMRDRDGQGGGMPVSGMTHLSLFSGIGGLDLAAEWAGFKTVGQCEFADYPTKVLENHWPNVPKWRDIHDLSGNAFRDKTGIERPTVISGGFPCQPHSVAGKRKASCDERDLWPEMRRVISEIAPRWVVGENVRGLLSSEDGRFFRGILRDFAYMGYDVGWCTYGAADVGAIHKRERIGIIAYRSCERNMGGKVQKHTTETGEQTQHGAYGRNKNAPNSNCVGLQRGDSKKKQQKDDEQFERACIHLLRTADPHYLSKSAILGEHDGVPYRVDRTKALGNAVVPQQFYPIFKAIADIELKGVTNGNNS